MIAIANGLDSSDDLHAETQCDLRALAEAFDAEPRLAAGLVASIRCVGGLPEVAADLRRSAATLAGLCSRSSPPIELFEVSHAVQYALVRLKECNEHWFGHRDTSTANSGSFQGTSL